MLQVDVIVQLPNYPALYFAIARLDLGVDTVAEFQACQISGF